jgi:hypothetical protein
MENETTASTGGKEQESEAEASQRVAKMRQLPPKEERNKKAKASKQEVKASKREAK